MPYYAVAVGRQVGIFDTYDECKLQIINYPKAKFKKFATLEEAEAFIKKYNKGADIWKNNDRMLQVSMQVDKLDLVNAKLHSIEQMLNEFIAETNNKFEYIISRMNRSEVNNRDTLNEPPFKKIKIDYNKEELVINEKGYVVVFTDGACSNNGKMNSKAGIGVWFNDDHPLNISAPLQGPATNNNAEIQAARIAITQAKYAGIQKLCIKTDSKFLINSITQFINKWKKNNWTLCDGTPVKNKEEIIKLDKAIQEIEVVEWIYVASHRGNHGNEMADKLARAGAKDYNINLTFSNKADNYNVKFVNSND